MQSKISYSLGLILLFSFGCSSTSQLTKGKVIPSDFHASVNFITVRSVMIIPCELDGELKNFIFDTGAQVTAIQRDSIFGKTITVRGSSNKTVESGTETVQSFRIAGVDFINTFATNGNEAYLKEKIPNYGGTIGRTIMDKANWLINYPAKILTLSNKELADENYKDIPLVKSSSTPYTMISIDNKEHRAIIDLGSSSIFNVPEDTELARELLEKYSFTERKRERYSVGGHETITELIGTVPLMIIGDNKFENITVNINQSSQIRLGMPFFKDYMIYMDNSNHRFRIKLAE